MRIRYHSFVCPVVLVLLAMGIGGCSSPSTPTSKSPKPSAGSKATDDPDPKAPNDESFTPEEYIRLGLPGQDREWSGDDMVKAEKVLASLTQKGYRNLPRYKSERSGEVFARLTSAQNLEQFRNGSLPLEARFPQFFNYLQASNQILSLYVSAFLKKEARDSELVELVGAEFRSTVVMLELIDEFLPTIKKDDPSYQVRMQGLEQTKRGLASAVAGGLQMLTERENYRGSELARLVGYMQETLPLIVPRLPPGSRTETMYRLEKMQEDPAMKDLQPSLQNLYLKVKAALEKGKAP